MRPETMQEAWMKREVIRVEPLSTYLERRKAPTSVVTRSGDTIYVSGLPPFEPDTGEIADAPFERQTELVLEQMRLCLETAGSSLDNVLKCNIYCTSVDKISAVNAIYARYFPKDPPARILVCVPAWPGRFDIEIDCIATPGLVGTIPDAIADPTLPGMDGFRCAPRVRSDDQYRDGGRRDRRAAARRRASAARARGSGAGPSQRRPRRLALTRRGLRR